MSKNNKFIIFIVEGSTDRESLALVLSRIFEKYNIQFKIVDGDITSDKNTTNFNIKNKLGKLIKEVQSNYHLKLTDIYKVIQVVDMDGVYIDDEHIVKDSTCTKAFYDKEEIRIRNPKTIIKRNDDKRRMLDMLSTTKQVLNIDYLCLYFSCNLEHVLQGNANISDDDKMSLAKAFRTEYYKKEDAFIKFICDSSFSVQLPYEDSWKYIKEENHSIERKTNFTCLFKAIESDN